MFRVIKIILDRNQGSLLCLAFIGALLGGMLLNNMQCVGAQEEGPTIEPDDKMQSIFTDIISPTEEDKEVFSDDGEKFLKAKLAELKQMGDGNVEYLLQQLIYFRANTKRMYNMKKITSNNMEKAMDIVGLIIIRECLNLNEDSTKLHSPSAQSAINAVVPYLGTKDPELKKQLHWVLEKIDFRGIEELNYAEYESYIENKKDNPPQALIQYMYYTSPGEALLSLMRVYMEDFGERQGIIQAEQVIRKDIEKRYHGPIEGKSKVAPQAKEALNELSKYNQWWIRLYVAEILLRQPKFRTPEILERLKKDKHPLVSEALSRF